MKRPESPETEREFVSALTAQRVADRCWQHGDGSHSSPGSKQRSQYGSCLSGNSIQVVTGQTGASVNVASDAAGCQVERRRMKGDSSAGTGALAEPLDIYFTISLCCKTERETEREGGRGGEISPGSYFPHSGELQAAQLHYTCTEQSAWQRFTKTTKYLVTYRLTCSAE